MTGSLPPGWPSEVRPPGSPEWERSAVAWLFDLVPPDYRRYDVLRKHPVLLARFATDHVEAGLAAARHGWRTLRADLGGDLGADVVDAAMSAYEREGLRLAEAARAVSLVDAALRGLAWVPRL